MIFFFLIFLKYFFFFFLGVWGGGGGGAKWWPVMSQPICLAVGMLGKSGGCVTILALSLDGVPDQSILPVHQLF